MSKISVSHVRRARQLQARQETYSKIHELQHTVCSLQSTVASWNAWYAGWSHAGYIHIPVPSPLAARARAIFTGLEVQVTQCQATQTDFTSAADADLVASGGVYAEIRARSNVSKHVALGSSPDIAGMSNAQVRRQHGDISRSPFDLNSIDWDAIAIGKSVVNSEMHEAVIISSSSSGAYVTPSVRSLIQHFGGTGDDDNSFSSGIPPHYGDLPYDLTSIDWDAITIDNSVVNECVVKAAIKLQSRFRIFSARKVVSKRRADQALANTMTAVRELNRQASLRAALSHPVDVQELERSWRANPTDYPAGTIIRYAKQSFYSERGFPFEGKILRRGFDLYRNQYRVWDFAERRDHWVDCWKCKSLNDFG